MLAFDCCASRRDTGKATIVCFDYPPPVRRSTRILKHSGKLGNKLLVTTPVETRSRVLWIVALAAALIGIESFFFPAFIIRPFSHQTPRGLLLAMAVRQRAPIVSLICVVVCLLACAMLWRRCTIFARAGLASILLVAAGSAVMSRQNYFEWMFHPVDSARFEPEASSKLDKGEMILTLRFGADPRAYPIKEMAYHHILNDVVGGVPVAVTY